MFTITLNVVHSLDASTKQFLERILSPNSGPTSPAELLAAITQGDTTIMRTIANLQDDVTAQTTVIGGVVTLLQGIQAQLAAAGTDPAKLDALGASIEANTAVLAGAVVAGTPADPSPVAGV